MLIPFGPVRTPRIASVTEENVNFEFVVNKMLRILSNHNGFIFQQYIQKS